MSKFYTPGQQALQEEFDSKALAARMEQSIAQEAFADEHRLFIESRDMFFLATVDEMGFPSCSYKGGKPGFVRVLNSQTLAFPIYDGNGMFMSAGNIDSSGTLALLFIDFATPHRLRVRGNAHLHREGALLASYPGAQLAVEVTVDRVWQNCPRYVHKMTQVHASPYVPDADGNSELALWKRIDGLQDVLSDADRQRASEAGLIAPEDYARKVQAGEVT